MSVCITTAITNLVCIHNNNDNPKIKNVQLFYKIYLAHSCLL